MTTWSFDCGTVTTDPTGASLTGRRRPPRHTRIVVAAPDYATALVDAALLAWRPDREVVALHLRL